jgi:hypothetical protein
VDVLIFHTFIINPLWGKDNLLVLERGLGEANVIPVERRVTPAVRLIEGGMMDYGQMTVVEAGQASGGGAEHEGDETNHKEVFDGVADFHVIIIWVVGGKLKLRRRRRFPYNRDL